jgi:hypothetical protein
VTNTLLHESSRFVASRPHLGHELCGVMIGIMSAARHRENPVNA